MLLSRAKKGDRSMPGIVLHGYKRPGLGYLQGECFGNGWPPFELSAEGTKAYEGYLEVLMKELEFRLGRLERDEEDVLVIGLRSYSRKDIPTDKWITYLDMALKHQISQIREVSRVQDLVQKKLVSWEPHPERLAL